MTPTTDTLMTFGQSFSLWQSNFLLVLDVILVVIFAASFVVKVRGSFFRLSILLSDPIKARWALGILFISRALDRFSEHIAARNLDTAAVHKALESGQLILAIWSALCLVRIFADVQWGRSAWIWATVLAAAGATLLDYFVI